MSASANIFSIISEGRIKEKFENPLEDMRNEFKQYLKSKRPLVKVK